MTLVHGYTHGESDDSRLVQVPKDLAEQVGGAVKLEALLRQQAITYGVSEAEVKNPNLRAALMRATTLSLNFGFLPGQHLHLQVTGGEEDLGHSRPRSATPPSKKYAIVIGVHAYQDSFARWKQETGKLAWVKTEELTPEQTAAITKARYPHMQSDVEDCGATAKFLDQEEAEFCRKMSLSYQPQLHYGFWRKKAFERWENNKKVWEADNIPNQRAPMDVALLRATKACLMAYVPLMPADTRSFTQRLAMLEDVVAPEPVPTEREQAPFAPPQHQLITEPDGDVLFVAPNPGKPVRNAVNVERPDSSFYTFY